MNRLRTMLLVMLTFVSMTAAAQRPEMRGGGPVREISSAAWKVGCDSLGLRSLVSCADPYGANLIEGSRLGAVNLCIRVKDGFWQNVSDSGRSAEFTDSGASYSESSTGGAVTLTQSFELRGDILHWGIRVENHSRFPVEIGDLAVAIPWKSGADEPDEIFQTCFIKHAFISGDASFFYFTRYSGERPYLMLIPDRGTPLEYYASTRGGYFAYIRSGKTGPRTEGNWRQEHTSEWLAPAGSDGSVREYGFIWSAEESYEAMREALYQGGSIDTKVVPGMTVPRGQKARFALRSMCSIDSVEAEFPQQTRVRKVSQDGDTHIFEVEFSRLGENMLTVWFDGGRKTCLEFFSSLPPKDLTLRRSSFLVNRQQFRDTGRWYDGLYGAYDMSTGTLHGPDNPGIFDEQRTYFIASDDPALGKAPFIASKNAVWPDAAEVESLEYHLEHFVWGGLQRTDAEGHHEYGVYGTPNWYVNRNQELRETQTDYRTGTIRTWRTYDYPHVFMLWWEMYRIARDYPELCRFKTAAEYLDIAFNTARVYFMYPTELLGDYYETYKWGAYNELVLVDIIDELEKVGRRSDAAHLRAEWEKKAKYFIYDDRYPFRSEYSADRTAFESSYALAKYGVMNEMKPDVNLWYDGNRGCWYSHPSVSRADAREFMERQHYANLACRGVLENQWFILGSDFFGSSDWSLMTYMARMGGWAVLDYGLRFADDPYEWLRLGYSSYLGQFALVNAGDEESDYGFWYPGKEKDGALGMSFTPVKSGGAWIGTREQRGPWRFCGEGDLGMCAITRTAETILAQDPTFGWTLYGGALERSSGSGDFEFIPEDGVGRAVYLVCDACRIGFTIDRGHWSSDVPVRVSSDMKKWTFTVVPDKVEGICEVPARCFTVDPIRCGGKFEVRADGHRLRARADRYGRMIYSLPASVCEVSVSISK